MSYDSDYQFDNLFLHFSVSGCVVRDLFQASLRARTITKNRLYYTNHSDTFQAKKIIIFEYKELKQMILSTQASEEHEELKLDEWAIE